MYVPTVFSRDILTKFFIILTKASFEGGIIRGAFFPQIASDTVRITLNMPNGTNEKVTDSIISYIEAKAIEVTDEINNEYSFDVRF